MKNLKMFIILIIFFSCQVAEYDLPVPPLTCYRSYSYGVCDGQIIYLDSTDREAPRTALQIQTMLNQTFSAQIERCGADSACIEIRTKYRTRIIDCQELTDNL